MKSSFYGDILDIEKQKAIANEFQSKSKGNKAGPQKKMRR
jgi:hypothetical protein